MKSNTCAVYEEPLSNPQVRRGGSSHLLHLVCFAEARIRVVIEYGYPVCRIASTGDAVDQRAFQEHGEEVVREAYRIVY